jgi:hypothetical protein
MRKIGKKIRKLLVKVLKFAELTEAFSEMNINIFLSSCLKQGRLEEELSEQLLSFNHSCKHRSSGLHSIFFSEFFLHFLTFPKLLSASSLL